MELTGATSIPNADAAPDALGINTLDIPSFLATFTACAGPAPPIAIIEKSRGS